MAADTWIRSLRGTNSRKTGGRQSQCSASLVSGFLEHQRRGSFGKFAFLGEIVLDGTAEVATLPRFPTSVMTDLQNTPEIGTLWGNTWKFHLKKLHLHCSLAGQKLPSRFIDILGPAVSVPISRIFSPIFVWLSLDPPTSVPPSRWFRSPLPTDCIFARGSCRSHRSCVFDLIVRKLTI